MNHKTDKQRHGNREIHKEIETKRKTKGAKTHRQRQRQRDRETVKHRKSGRCDDENEKKIAQSHFS